MFEIPDTLFDRLGLKEQSDLTDLMAPRSRSYQVQDLRGRSASGQLLLKIFDSASDRAAATGLWDTGRWSTRNVDLWSTGDHGKDGAADPAVAAAAGLQNLHLNWLISEQAGHQFFPEIIEVGQLDGFPYLLRPYQPQSLTTLARTHVVPNPAMLYHIAAGIWTSLAFLHQPEVNTPHGNLKLANVLIGKGPVHEAPVYLCDAEETSETERRTLKRDDFRGLGVILCQLVAGDPSTLSFSDAQLRAEAADWSALGREARAWQELAVKLLREDSYRDFNPVAARQDWLEPVRPKKARVVPVPLPVPASPAGPTLGGDAQPKPPEQTCSDIDEKIRAGDFVGGLEMGLKALAGATTADPDILSRIDYCAANLPADALEGNSANLMLLEEAANRSSSSAAYRLGLALMKINADEAIVWLDAAAASGIHDALPVLARLVEDGTPVKPADAERAVGLLEEYRAAHPDGDGDYMLAAMILRGRTSRQPGDAVELLETLHEAGNFRATDLLAQCHATGLGTEINEKKAYGLFAAAWNQSKSLNSHYHTASNNLGVCFAVGFGVARDPESAKHYFRQGAIHKHPTSEENLERLRKAGY